MSGLAELAPILKTGGIAVVKRVGFFDESEDQEILCMAGVFGPVHHWVPFEDAWSSLLQELEIDEFHMSDCENRRGAWESWTNPSDRHQAQHRFIDLIVEHPYPTPSGLVVAIDLESVAGGTTKPWLVAFEHLVAGMIEGQEVFNQITGVQDQVALVFDDKDEFRGRALGMVEKARTTVQNGHLLGPVTFDDSANQPALQAADLLAYETRRCILNVFKNNHSPRPQWVRLQNAKSMPSGRRRIWAEYYRDPITGFHGIKG